LYDNDGGYELAKQYNQPIKHKYYLKRLTYNHNRVGGYEYCISEQEIQ